MSTKKNGIISYRKCDEKEGRRHNIGFAKWRVPCFVETFVQGGSSVLRMKFSAKTPRHRKPPKHYPMVSTSIKYLTLIKVIRTAFLILLFANQISAQKILTTVKIIPKNYVHYEWTKELSSCAEEDTIDTANVRCYLVVNYSYPQFATSNAKFTQLMNNAIRSTFDYSDSSTKTPKFKPTNCNEDKPAYETMEYKIHLKANSFLSFVILKDYEPSGYGNGFRHDAIPFTFDIDNKKLLKLGDIIKDDSDTVIYNMIIAKIKASTPDLFLETGEINNPGLFHKFSTLDFPFVMTQYSIILYYSLSYGGKYSFEEIEIKLSENSELFDDQRVLHLIQTRTR